jgi:hypothetical protein
MERAVPVLPGDSVSVARTFSVTDPFGNTIFVMGPVT